MLVYTRLQNSNFNSNLYLKVVANRTRIWALVMMRASVGAGDGRTVNVIQLLAQR